MRSKTVLISLAIFFLLVGYVIVMQGKVAQHTTSKPTELTSTKIDKSNVLITTQKSAFGISGKVVQMLDGSFTLETAVLPGYGSAIAKTWTWTVLYNADTNVVREEKKEPISSIRNLPPGSRVTVASRDNITEQFSTDQKRMIASEIRIYP